MEPESVIRSSWRTAERSSVPFKGRHTGRIRELPFWLMLLPARLTIVRVT
jgi:hypothetical protein